MDARHSWHGGCCIPGMAGRLACGLAIAACGTALAGGCVTQGASHGPPRIPAVFSVGASTRTLDLSHRTVTGLDSSGQPASTSAAPMGAFRGEMLDAVAGVYLGPLFFACETQFGTGSIDHPLAAAVAARGGPSGPPFGVTSGGVYASGGLVTGVALPRLATLTPQLELYAGGAGMFLTPDDASRYPCDPDGGCQVPGVGTWIVEPRVRLRGFIHPNASIDAWAGRGIGPSSGDWSLGIAIAFHRLPFDGR